MKKDSRRKIHPCCPARIEDSGYSSSYHSASKLMCTEDIQYFHGGTSEKIVEEGDTQFAAPPFLLW